MGDEHDVTRLKRMLSRSTLRRTTAISQIRRIHAMSLRIPNEPQLSAEFSVNASDLEALWTQFKTDNDEVLDCLLVLDRIDEYTPDLSAEVRELVNASKAVAKSLIPKGAEAIDISYIQNKLQSVPTLPDETNTSFSRLPEIPLPSFAGDFREWPGCRDKFSTLVDGRTTINRG